MIKFLDERGESQNALTVLPDTAEFLALKSVLDEKGTAKLDLVAAVMKAFGDAVDAHADRDQKGIRPDDLYDDTLVGAKIRERWENTFGGQEEGRDLFGLVAWKYFFDHKSTWCREGFRYSRPRQAGLDLPARGRDGSTQFRRRGRVPSYGPRPELGCGRAQWFHSNGNLSTGECRGN